MEFNHDGDLLATGDKGGRVVIFQRDPIVSHIYHSLNCSICIHCVVEIRVISQCEYINHYENCWFSVDLECSRALLLGQAVGILTIYNYFV